MPLRLGLGLGLWLSLGLAAAEDAGAADAADAVEGAAAGALVKGNRLLPASERLYGATRIGSEPVASALERGRKGSTAKAEGGPRV